MEQRYVIWNGDRLGYLWQEGETGLVLLHGLCGSANHFDRVFDAESLDNVAIAAIDLPGFGESGNAAAFSLDAMADAVSTVVQEAGFVSRPWVVAHSMSSSVVVRMLDEISGLTLLEGNLLPCHLEFSDKIIGFECEAYPAEYDRLRKSAEMVLKFQTRVTDAGKRRRYADSYEACSAETVWRTAKQINGDIRSGLPLRRLAAWSGPVCCVYGALSGYGATLDTISRRLAWRTVHRIEDAAHFPMMDNPQDTYAAVTHDLNS